MKKLLSALPLLLLLLINDVSALSTFTPTLRGSVNNPGLNTSQIDGNFNGIATVANSCASALTSSSSLFSAISDETGTGALVGNISPTLITPNLGTPTALVLTNATGLPNAGLTNSTITFGATSAALGSTVSALNSVTVGATTPSTGAFTTLTSSSTTTATAFIPNSSSVPTNGIYLPAVNTVGISTNSTQQSFIDANGIEYQASATPNAQTATGTLTIANLQTSIITVTSATAVSLTLPTGTLTDSSIIGGVSAANISFDWSIINLGSASGAVTLVAGTGHTIVGGTGVPISTSARFRTRKTATNTYVTYRLG